MTNEELKNQGNQDKDKDNDTTTTEKKVRDKQANDDMNKKDNYSSAVYSSGISTRDSKSRKV